MSPGPTGGDTPSHTAPGRREEKEQERVEGEGGVKVGGGGQRWNKNEREQRQRHKLVSVCLSDHLNSCVHRGTQTRKCERWIDRGGAEEDRDVSERKRE